VDEIIRIGLDTSKHVYQLHGVNAAEEPVLRKKLRRKEMMTFFERLTPTVIAIEACGGSHHLARSLETFGHEVRLIPPQYVKPYVKRGKNDAADAEALCEAMSRPTMRFVPVKSAERQAALMLVGLRDRLIRNQTQLANGIRGYAAEFGLIAATGLCKIEPLLGRIAADENLPALARELFAVQAEEYALIQAELKVIEAKLTAWHRASSCSRRLAQIPGVGPVGASMLTMKTPDPGLFRSGRQFAAWLPGPAQAQTAEACCRGVGQQDRAHCLEAHGERRDLRRKGEAIRCCGCFLIDRRDRMRSKSNCRVDAAPCKERVDGDRSVRDERDAAACIGRYRPTECLALTLRKPSWPAVMSDRHHEAGHMIASDSIIVAQDLAGRRPSTYVCWC